MKKVAVKKTVQQFWFWSAALSLISLIVLVAGLTIFLAYYQNRIYSGIKIASFDLSGKTPHEAEQILNQEFLARNHPLEVISDKQSFTLSPNLAGAKINTSEIIQQAWLIGRSSDYLRDVKDLLKVSLHPTILNLEISYSNTQALLSQIEAINEALAEPSTPAIINPINLEITPSKDGVVLDKIKTFTEVNDYLSLKTVSPRRLVLKTAPPFFNTTKAILVKNSLQSVNQTNIKLSYNQMNWSINQPTLLSLINLIGLKDQELLDSQKLDNFLQPIASNIYKPVKNARFNLDPTTKKVSEFQTAESGTELDLDQTKNLITQAALNKIPHEISLPVKITEPSVTSSNATDFGIEELLAEGVSYFAGSIENRVYNIGLAASRINGVLLAPNEIFSFNNTLGDITGATGYKPAYVIKSGRTVLDDGGGVCQVSTTLFRAVLNAGLPILARTAHAYRVGYYEQGFSPGLDATIFYPSVDFKFKNDTGQYLLIQTRVVGSTLYVDLYGKTDGREVNLTKPSISNIMPAPPDLRQDDPTLPRGVIKQVDWSAPGANVYFKRVVTRAGQVLIDEGYTSNYRPWQAIYLVGTQ